MTRVMMAGGGTGGHLYPALALADAMSHQRADLELHFVGAERGVEARVLPEKGIPHTLLPMLPFFRDRVWRNWKLVPATLRVARGLSALFGRFRPQLVVGTGGYASGPAGLLAVVKGVPLAIQEQNSWPGVTTRLLAPFARQIHLGFPEAEGRLRPGKRTRVFALGNPVRAPGTELDGAEARRRFDLPSGSAVVLVVGGSQGSRALNEAVIEAVEQRSADDSASQLALLWATGPAHFEGIRSRLDAAGAHWVRALPYIDDMPAALASADLAVSRAGAMTTGELLAWGVPAILVPLPTAAADHQTHNARALEAAGAAICITEADLTPARLWAEVISLVRDPERRERMAKRASERARPHAAEEIAREMLTLVAA